MVRAGALRASKAPVDRDAEGVSPVASGSFPPLAPTSLRLADGQHFYGHGQVTDATLAQNAGAQGPNGQPATPSVNLTVRSPDGFPARDALPQLHVGAQTYTLSGYGDATLKALVFKIPVAEFRALTAGSSVVVSYGDLTTTTYVIDAGTLPQDVLDGVQ